MNIATNIFPCQNVPTSRAKCTHGGHFAQNRRFFVKIALKRRTCPAIYNYHRRKSKYIESCGILLGVQQNKNESDRSKIKPLRAIPADMLEMRGGSKGSSPNESGWGVNKEKKKRTSLSASTTLCDLSNDVNMLVAT